MTNEEKEIYKVRFDDLSPSLQKLFNVFISRDEFNKLVSDLDTVKGQVSDIEVTIGFQKPSKYRTMKNLHTTSSTVLSAAVNNTGEWQNYAMILGNHYDKNNPQSIVEEISSTAYYSINIEQSPHQTIKSINDGKIYTNSYRAMRGSQIINTVTADTGYTAGVLNYTKIDGVTDNTIIKASSAFRQIYTVDIIQSDRQLITVVCNGQSHTNSFTCNYGDSIICTIASTDSKYITGTLNITAQTVISNITIQATPAEKKLTVCDLTLYSYRNIQNWNILANIPEANLAYLNSALAPTSIQSIFGQGLQNGDVQTAMKKLVHIDKLDLETKNCTDMRYAFYGCENLDSFSFLSNWNTESCINMLAMFSLCKSVKNIDISKWNTSSVQNMSYMFGGCTSLESVDMSNCDTSKVTTFQGMFGPNGDRRTALTKLTSIKGILDLTSCTNYLGMFEYCSGLNHENPVRIKLPERIAMGDFIEGSLIPNTDAILFVV